MKLPILLPVIFLFISTTLSAQQWVEIPDPNLRAALQQFNSINPAANLTPFFNGDSLDVSVAEVQGAQSLVIDDWGITDLTGLEHFTGVTILVARDNNLQTIQALPPTLSTLKVENNQLTEIPLLPATLTHLYCHDNSISSILELPENLIHLDCYGNDLTVLPNLPLTLQDLDCSGNQLESLPTLPSQIHTLNCTGNSLQTLPPLPSSLITLICSTNPITELPALPANLFDLICAQTDLQGLPPLPQGLDRINTFSSPVESLPTLPESLTELSVSGGELQSLPTLPSGLEYLSCNLNNLQSLPELPNGLEALICWGNQLSCLPPLPNTLTQLYHTSTSSNPNWATNNIQCVPNNPPLLTNPSEQPAIPVCTANNIFGCDWLTLVTGTVHKDENDNCTEESGEVKLNGRIVSSNSGSFGISDSLGIYKLYLDTGSHIITQSQPNNLWGFDCSMIPYTVIVDEVEDTIPNIDFPNHATDDCAWLTVSLSSSNQRPCFSTNSYHLEYCNQGTEEATDAYIELQLSPDVIPLTGSAPWTDLGNNVIRFELGDLAIDECGSISFTDSVGCNVTPGFTVCARAEIFPISPCFIGEPNWDYSSIEVTSECVNGNAIEFTVTNIGTGDMTAPSNYRIFQDFSIYQDDTPFQLQAGESVVVTAPANGQVYRLSADQSAGHPGISTPQAWVEACGTPPYFFGTVSGFVQDDHDDHVDIHCTMLTAAYDPNDKTVVPAGFGAEHNIQMSDTSLEYRIRFQNTGSDTAFNVVVVDTLDLDVLDITTFVSGASSHPYSVEIYGPGIVSWHFDNILLPDSNVNDPASNGFVSFNIDRFSDLPVSTVINNSASIYFDFNAPIYTNTSFVTLSDPQMLVSINEGIKGSLRIHPNPASSETTVSFDQDMNGELKLIDALGRTVLSQQFSGSQSRLNVEHLIPGLYFTHFSDINGNEEVLKLNVAR